MHRFNNNLVLQGTLALLAFALLLVVAAKALQPQPESTPDSVVAAAMQGTQAAGPSSESSAFVVSQDGKTEIFHGTIVKDGSNFVLRDPSGIVYRLDQPDRARPFVGTTVKLTGQVEKDAKLIHVARIDKVAA